MYIVSVWYNGQNREDRKFARRDSAFAWIMRQFISESSLVSIYDLDRGRIVFKSGPYYIMLCEVTK